MYIFSNAVQVSLYFLEWKVGIFQTTMSILDFIKVHLLLLKKILYNPNRILQSLLYQ